MCLQEPSLPDRMSDRKVCVNGIHQTCQSTLFGLTEVLLQVYFASWTLMLHSLLSGVALVCSNAQLHAQSLTQVIS